jgi:hypothetical protein
MNVPGEVHELVERFESNREAYRSGGYNETQARVDFIDSLFALLGWDVYNRQGRPEAYWKVVREDRVKIRGGTKAPDYDFCVGGENRAGEDRRRCRGDVEDDRRQERGALLARQGVGSAR